MKWMKHSACQNSALIGWRRHAEVSHWTVPWGFCLLRENRKQHLTHCRLFPPKKWLIVLLNCDLWPAPQRCCLAINLVNLNRGKHLSRVHIYPQYPVLPDCFLWQPTFKLNATQKRRAVSLHNQWTCGRQWAGVFIEQETCRRSDRNSSRTFCYTSTR